MRKGESTFKVLEMVLKKGGFGDVKKDAMFFKSNTNFGLLK